MIRIEPNRVLARNPDTVLLINSHDVCRVFCAARKLARRSLDGVEVAPRLVQPPEAASGPSAILLMYNTSKRVNGLIS